MPRETAIITAGAGFLLAVLWLDLMFDVQVRRRRGGQRVSPGSPLPEEVLASIAGYYRRVTTEAQPMGRLIAVVMVATLAAIGVQIADGDSPRWVGVTALVLTLLAVGIAAVHTVPAAVRLGARGDAAEEQTRLARAILRAHLVCLAAIAAVLAIELAWG